MNAGTLILSALAYDPVDNVFIFITDERRTRAYRYRNQALHGPLSLPA